MPCGMAALLSCLLGVASPAQSPGALEPIDLHIAFTRSSFLGVNELDAKAAFTVFATRMGEKRGYDITPRVRIFDDVSELAAAIRRNALDLIIIDSWDYLTHAPFTNAPVEFSAVEQGVVHEPYVLLAKRDSGVSGMSDLKDKHVIVLDSCNANTCRYWLQAEFMALGAADPDAFARRVEHSHRVSQAILPVFFGQADACAVDQSGLAIMSEMNPQVGKRLAVVAESAPFLDTICCVRLAGWEEARHRPDLLDAMREITDDPAGRQILTLFKFDGMVPFKEEHLDTMRALRERHAALTAAHAAKRTAEGGP
jgi:ABC-type phosphate/phosphonate transport system substrate-binding protein